MTSRLLPRDTMLVLKKDNVRLQIQKIKEKEYIQVECPPDTVFMVTTKIVTVVQAPATYKEFMKHLMHWNNFQFWLFHTIAGIVGLFFLLTKVFKIKLF